MGSEPGMPRASSPPGLSAEPQIGSCQIPHWTLPSAPSVQSSQSEISASPLPEAGEGHAYSRGKITGAGAPARRLGWATELPSSPTPLPH